MRYSYLPWQPIPKDVSTFLDIRVGHFVYDPPTLSCIIISSNSAEGVFTRLIRAWRMSFDGVNAFRCQVEGATPDMPDFINADGVCLVSPSVYERGPATWEVQGAPLMSRASTKRQYHHYAIASCDTTFEVVAYSWQSEFLTDDWLTYYQTLKLADNWYR